MIAAQKLIPLLPDETVESCLAKLAEFHITAAPVLENVGLVGVLDLLAFLVKTSTKILVDDVSGESRNLTTDDMRMLRKRAKDFKLGKVQDLIDYSKKNPWVYLFDDQTVADAMVTFSQGIHRVILFKRDSNKMLGILTQSDVVRFLAEEQKTQFEIPVSHLKNKTEKLITVSQSTLAFDSFLKIHDNGLSSVGVLNHLGQLIGNLSAADLRLAAKDFTLLLRSTKDYLSLVRKVEGRPSGFTVVCSTDTPLQKCVESMGAQKVHRIYIVDADQKPQAVISFTDILREIYTHA